MHQQAIAIVPARAGSKRCPNKNIAQFKGKSMVAHTIEQALATKKFDKIIFSSDDPEIIDAAAPYQVQIDRRDVSLASDNAPLIDLIRNIIAKYNIHDSCIVALLLVTGPLRNIEDITRAFDLFADSNRKQSVVSVTINENPVEMNWRMENGFLKQIFPDRLKTTRKQDFMQSYRYNDAVILDTAQNFMDPDRNLFGTDPIPYIMPPERSINIDYEFQLKIVQLVGEHSL